MDIKELNHEELKKVTGGSDVSEQEAKAAAEMLNKVHEIEGEWGGAALKEAGSSAIYGEGSPASANANIKDR